MSETAWINVGWMIVTVIVTVICVYAICMVLEEKD